MKIKVELVISQIDYLDNSEEKAFGIKGFRENNKLIYEENDTKAQVTLTLDNNGIHIHRICDNITEIELVEGGGIAKISSEYGEMVFRTKLIEKGIKEDKVIVEYQLLSEQEIVTHKRVQWVIID